VNVRELIQIPHYENLFEKYTNEHIFFESFNEVVSPFTPRTVGFLGDGWGQLCSPAAPHIPPNDTRRGQHDAARWSARRAATNPK
jgi:hypothetical protein